MKKKTYKIIICIGLVMMIFANFSSVFGAINESYHKDTQVSDTALDSKIQGSALLDIFANMINAVASLAETLIGNIFQVLTQDKIFPWADRIIFNSIEFLDINFLNPADTSLFGSSSHPSVLGKVVKRVYSTIFSLAVLFLGVAVGVMAIRLAISSIATEKARYKQAIVNWATCIVMLFLMHYILAFVFWINEQMVEIASNILLNTIETENLGNIDFTKALDIKPDQRVNNFINQIDSDVAKEGSPSSAIKILKGNPDVAASLLSNSLYTPPKSADGYGYRIVNEDLVDEGEKSPLGNNYMGYYAATILAHDTHAGAEISQLYSESKGKKDSDNKFKTQKDKGYFNISAPTGTDLGSADKVFISEDAFKNSDEYVETLKLIYICLLKDEQNMMWYDSERPWKDKVYKYKKFDYYTFVKDNSKYDDIKEKIKDDELEDNDASISDSIKMVKLNKSQLERKLGSGICNSAVKFRMNVDKAIYNAAMGKSSLSSSAQDIIANLGSFFKQSAYVYKTETTTDDDGDDKEAVTGWRASEVSVTGALLYGIFIFQSCIYLIMYVKRLFYVIMLSMFGPIVVIYDFFMKSVG